MFTRGRGKTARSKATELRKDIVGRFHQLRPQFDKRVAAFGKRRMDRAGNCKHFASLVGGAASRNKRSRGERGFYDKAALRKTADEAIAPGKVLSRGRRPGSEL